MTTPRLLLASTSSYRRQLLLRLGVDFECAHPDVDELALACGITDPEQVARRLARAKAEAVWEAQADAFVLGADQLVDLDGEILGQPGSVEAACAQLAAMAGRQHRLLTAVCLCVPGRPTRELFDVHRMRMRALSREEIERYVAHDECLDCAGSYKVEGLGIALFDTIEGQDFTAIEGLPLMGVAALLREAGFAVP
ncbi:MAG: septum formation protein Maf [Myxococcales bacterium]|nr:septum formation protein Maf [Myxococcales bacterium]